MPTVRYYDLLGVPRDASAEDIKRAFRREIAKYHPDKVQHLGREFQEIAAVRAAELTLAYKTLTDVLLRAEYDGESADESSSKRETGDPHGSGWTAQEADAPATPPPDPVRRVATPSHDRAGVSDLVRKAAVGRFRQAVESELGRCEEAPVLGFDLACAPPRGRFWSKAQPRLLAKFVAQVDGAAVAESWTLVSQMKRDELRDVCLFLMGPAVASIAELSKAIADARRKPLPAGTKVVLVPINAKTWTAHIPNDAPDVARALIARLKTS